MFGVGAVSSITLIVSADRSNCFRSSCSLKLLERKASPSAMFSLHPQGLHTNNHIRLPPPSQVLIRKFFYRFRALPRRGALVKLNNFFTDLISEISLLALEFRQRPAQT